MQLLFLLLICAPSLYGNTLFFEAEKATLFNVVATDSVSGFSGNGYVSRFLEDQDSLQFTFKTDAGLYRLLIGYATPNRRKGFSLSVNNYRNTGIFADSRWKFSEHDAGIFQLVDGVNRICITKGWGHYAVDYIRLEPTTVQLPSTIDSPLCDKQASSATQALYNFLENHYCSKILSGQQNLNDIKYVKSVTGKSPAVGAFDLIDYSPSRIAHKPDTNKVVKRWISWAQKGHGIVTLCWHWNAPTDLINMHGKEWFRGFYTHATTFDFEAALDDTTSEDYALLLRDIDAIAKQLNKFQQADIPVLWRPLHEAAGGWFWWGSKGPDAFKQLWKLLYKRIVYTHQIHNLIWVFTSDDQHDWYPGDDVVDIIGMDIYTAPSSNLTGEWNMIQQQFSGKKLVTLSESGTLPIPENCRLYGTWWSWFAVWDGQFIRKIDKRLLKHVYSDKDVITLDELPDWRHMDYREGK
jgi:mannan endo-1,4-beta-mannosidase